MRPTSSGRIHSGRRPALLLAAALCLVPLAACGDDGGGSGGKGDGAQKPTVDVGATATVTVATTPTTTPTTPTTTAPAAPVGRPDPHEAAKVLYDAWKASDRVTAATVADSTAVDSMWQTAPGDYKLYNKCNTGEFGSSACLYRGAPGTIQFAMEQRDTAWVVVEAVFSPA